MKPVWEFLGPAGTAIFKALPMLLHGSGAMFGPWSAGSARGRSKIGRPIIDSGGNIHNDATGGWYQSPYPGGKDTP